MSIAMKGKEAMRLRHATTDDLAAIEALLLACALPVVAVAEHVENFLLAEGPKGELLGCAGLEYYGDSALLRSVAVAPDARSTGVAAGLVGPLLEECRLRGIRCMALLTISAESYFAQHGFTRVERSAVPPRLLESSQFQGVCPASATAMLRLL
ncbi:arsenic resistance N-acetyltransferase ArsN2 [Cupriavidus sp. CP313]